MAISLKTDRQIASSTTTQSTTSTTFVDVTGYTLTTKRLDTNGTYQILFSCQFTASANDKVGEFQIVVNGSALTYTVMQQNGHPARPQILCISAQASGISVGQVIKVQFRSIDGTQMNVVKGSLSILGLSSNSVVT